MFVCTMHIRCMCLYVYLTDPPNCMRVCICIAVYIYIYTHMQTHYCVCCIFAHIRAHCMCALYVFTCSLICLYMLSGPGPPPPPPPPGPRPGRPLLPAVPDNLNEPKPERGKTMEDHTPAPPPAPYQTIPLGGGGGLGTPEIGPLCLHGGLHARTSMSDSDTSSADRTRSRSLTLSLNPKTFVALTFV